MEKDWETAFIQLTFIFASLMSAFFFWVAMLSFAHSVGILRGTRRFDYTQTCIGEAYSYTWHGGTC